VRSTSVGQRVAQHPVMEVLARVGLTAQAIVYLVIGWLAIQIARGHGRHEANSHGALSDIVSQPYGKVLLSILGIGFAAYAIWRISESVLGTATDGKRPAPRIKSLASGVIYAGFCVATFRFLATASQQTGSQQQVAVTARAMSHTDGRWLVGAIGVVVVAIGLVIAIQGARRTFTKVLQLQKMNAATRPVVIWLGTIGTVARGVVFTLAGLLVIDAAAKFKAGKSTGLDGALQTLAHAPYGPWILGTVAVGLIAFGLYGLAEARWARTSPPDDRSSRTTSAARQNSSV
jgi:Domain of Unknown Function (DUF1206)